MNFPPSLSREKEDALVKKGTKKSLEKLILHNMAEAVIYSRHCSRGALSEGELISLSWVALQAASRTYCCRHGSGIRFLAFGKPSLRGQIKAERKKNRVVRNADHQPIDIVNDIPLVETTVEPDHSNIESKELLAGLRPALFSELTDRERAIIILRYSAGFSFTEIGERIGYSRQSVQKTHAKSMEKLRSVLLEKRAQLI